MLNLFFLDIFSGMRQSEILGLRWADIDWNRNSLAVRKQLQQKCKKGDYSYTLIDPKENKRYGRLHVPFSAPLIRYDFVRKRR